MSSHFGACSPKNGWWTTLLYGNGGLKKWKHIKHRRTKQKGKVHMASYCVKFLEDGCPRVGVESICDIHF
jgi:hypothetical protein